MTLHLTDAEILRAMEEVCRRDVGSFAARAFTCLNPGTIFLPNYHIDALAFHLQEVYLGNKKRLMVNMPPRYGKTSLITASFPVFVLGHDPSTPIIVVSHTLDLVRKFGNYFRRLVESPLVRSIYPNLHLAGKNTELEIATSEGGYWLGASIDAFPIGRGARYVIFDDPATPGASATARKHLIEFYQYMRGRLDDHGRVIIAMQRLHPDDLCGHLLRTEPDNWSHLNLAAIAEKDEDIQIGEKQYYHRKAGEPLHAARHSAEYLEELRREVGPYVFASHYQQAPMSRETGIFNPEAIRRYDQAPTAVPPAYVLQSWDMALKTETFHDYSACVTLLVKGLDFYVLDVFRDRLHFFDLVECAIPLAQRYNPSNILVEDNGGVGLALVDKLQSVNLPATPVRAVGDKIARFSIQAAKVRARRFHLPRHAAWLADFEAEFFAVPHAAHDDQVDALVQALAHTDAPAYSWDEKSLAGLARFTQAIAFPFWPLH